MDLKSFKKKFKKVETLLTMIDGAGEANDVEKDLLKLYLQDLIDTIGGESIKAKVEEPVVAKKEEKPTDIIPAAAKQAPEPKAEMPEVVAEKPEMIEVIPQAPVEKEVVMAEADSKLKESTKAPAIKQAVKEVSTGGSMDALFESEEITDLSHKLSLTKVSNIGKSMGINEKVFTIKELFGGDQQSFNEVLSSIHEMKSYDEAVSYLRSGVAATNDWSSPSNIKKAKKFLKLVQRRFV